MVTDQTLRTKGLGSRLREADLTFLAMSIAVSARPPPPELGSVSNPPGVHSSSVESLRLHSMGPCRSEEGCELGRCAGASPGIPRPAMNPAASGGHTVEPVIEEDF